MSDEKKHRILLVDDEVAITKSLYRLFRNEGYRIDMCQSGADGLKLIEKEADAFSLIISDQRMPGMDGSEFLEKTLDLAPDAIRFLLTGYSDMHAVVNAVNKGKIHRYLTKPWNDDAIRLHVKQAIQEVELRRENERLNRLTKKQNKQLYELGVSLDKKVKDRTRKLKESNAELEHLNRKLEENFLSTIQLIISLIETTNRTLGKHLRHSGRLSKSVALEMRISSIDSENIETAGLLHDIGLFGMPEHFLGVFENELTEEELTRYRQHPVYASISLEMVEKLSVICDIVLHHHERYDGNGFPNGFEGESIPIGARILAAVSDYCRVVNCWPKDRQMIRKKLKDFHDIAFDPSGIRTTDECLRVAAEKILLDGIYKKYDPTVVTAMISIFRKEASGVIEKKPGLVPIEALRPGMVIPQDLFMKNGRLLLAQSTVLDTTNIRAIQKMGQMKMIPEAISISSLEK